MSTPEERFDQVVNHVETILDMLSSMNKLGIYGKMEYSAGVVFMETFERTLRILNPERANEYLASTVQEALQVTSESEEAVRNELLKKVSNQTGLYL